MELEEAIKYLNLMKTDKNNLNKIGYLYAKEAIEIILKALEKEDSITKKRIEDKLKDLSEENEVITQEEYYARSYLRKFLKELLEEK